MEISGKFWVYPNGDEVLEKTKSCRQGSNPKGTTDQEQGVLLPLHIPIGFPPPCLLPFHLFLRVLSSLEVIASYLMMGFI
jgi:hypothetical protein